MVTKFCPETKSLLAASADQIRSYPVSNLHATPEVFETDWGNTLKDLQISAGSKLLGVSTDSSVVNVWVGKLEPGKVGSSLCPDRNRLCRILVLVSSVSRFIGFLDVHLRSFCVMGASLKKKSFLAPQKNTGGRSAY